jgi:2-polyprenyl-3-methyl-5-hydroxy-6-metoxy-1,4-benzoquinol methylase
VSELSTAPTDLSDETHAMICRICQAGQQDQLYRQRSFDVLRCKKCGTVFVQPTDQSAILELARRASEEGNRYMREVFIERQTFWLQYWAGRLRRIESLLGRTGRLLDIGCAMGYFQLAAERQGWTAVGVEVSQEQAVYAREMLGLDVYTGRFEDTDFESASFDLITLWGVIEHVSDPRRFLVQARKLLKSDGMLVLQTPNQGSLITILAQLGYYLSLGSYLLPVYSLDNIFRFDEQTLRQLIEWSGFETVRIEQYDNLEVMLTRMALQPNLRLRRMALTFLHRLAAWLERRNQLVAYAKAEDRGSPFRKAFR